MIKLGAIKDWNIEEMTGYKPISTFYTDLGLAEQFGKTAIKDTCDRVIKEWFKDYRMFTEFVMTLNWKSWEHKDDDLCELYCKLYYKMDGLVMDKWGEEAVRYYLRTTD